MEGVSLRTSTRVTGMTSTGSEELLPFPGREGAQTTCITEDAYFLSITLPAFLSHYRPAQTPWGIILVEVERSVCAHAQSARGWKSKTVSSSQRDRHVQPSHDGPVHSPSDAEALGVCDYPRGVSEQESSCSIDMYNNTLPARSQRQAPLTSPPHLGFLALL